MNKKLLKVLACPKCKSDLRYSKSFVVCKKEHKFSIIDGVPDFLVGFDENKEYQEEIWAGKTYKVDPEGYVFTTIQERYGNRIIKSIGLSDDAVVADVGCFIGEKLWQLKDNKKYLGIGVDIAIPSLVAAKEIDVYGHEFIAGDLEALPFIDESLDLVMVFDVIEHLSDQDKGFKEISRVLKPAGVFLLHIPIKNNQFSFFWWKRKLFPKAAEKEYLDVGHSDERMLTTHQIEDYLKKYKMKIEKEVYYNSFFVHFFDREFSRIIGNTIAKFMGIKSGRLTESAEEYDLEFKSGAKSTKSSSESLKTIHSEGFSFARSVFGKVVVPFLELISTPDILLSKMKVGNTYFVIARKEQEY